MHRQLVPKATQQPHQLSLSILAAPAGTLARLCEQFPERRMTSLISCKKAALMVTEATAVDRFSDLSMAGPPYRVGHYRTPSMGVSLLRPAATRSAAAKQIGLFEKTCN
jgi:hypothetical protein